MKKKKKRRMTKRPQVRRQEVLRLMVLKQPLTMMMMMLLRAVRTKPGATMMQGSRRTWIWKAGTAVEAEAEAEGRATSPWRPCSRSRSRTGRRSPGTP